jgi:pimeloyl-ACP methyl ester carboxylesterase
VKSQKIVTNGITLNVVQEGPKSGRLVILLHGFPEFSYAWRRQTPYLADAGYRVWAPDQRGYNLSDKPPKVVDYAIDKLARDLIGLIDAAGKEKAILVGHDWGGVVSWWAAAEYPERFERLVILNAPHGAVMAESLRQNRTQRARSRYMLFFQLPWLPEWLSKANNWRRAVKALRNTSRPGAFTDQDLAAYREAWSQPGSYTGMLNWYRAAFRHPPPPPKNRQISVPTLVIWGAKDRFLGKEMAQPSINRCEDGRLVILEEATHWVQHDEPDRVSALIADFFHAGEPK